MNIEFTLGGIISLVILFYLVYMLLKADEL
ncbi:hypothetical protein V518_0995 [Thermoanaerobacterium aotearoense SCUT27]|uniref:Uncharacterized protein n=1 Tax=Thermoanaerobacterium aotearoense SCUT27 TaxID=1421016 RepID=W9ECV6_9THEO|nr:hypothetical protein V518_0995 [Thermoanaerobacterium aotearoense SCUT27]HHV74815.1 K(+)-transporting ATPase subunit F [Thermoanaerobacterium sp.]